LTTLFLRLSTRHLSRHAWLAALSVVGIALGVAVVVAIDLANDSARRAFALSTEAVLGKATHQIVAGPSGVPETVYVRLRVDQGAREAAPVVEGYARSASDPGRTFHLLGIDPVADASFRGYTGKLDRLDLRALLLEPPSVFLASSTASQLGVKAGDPLRLSVNGLPRELRVAGLWEPQGDRSASALEDLLVTDISTAQDLFGRGRLSRIDLVIEDSERGRARLETLARALPPGVDIVPAASRTKAMAEMTRAFSLNLSALSLLALLVGMFLIYNAMTFSVVERRPLLGTLRAMGVTRREVFGLVLGEAVLVAAAGTLLGGVLGIVIGSGLVKLVTRTINDLYFVVSVRRLWLAPVTLGKGIGLGFGATLFASLAPAWEATRVPPVVTLRRSSPETRLLAMAPRIALWGVALAGLGALSLAASRRSLFFCYVGLFAVVFGAALVTPYAARLLVRGFEPIWIRLFGPLGRMAARSIVASFTRTSVALAALTIAVATAVGVGIMVQSFRGTVARWLEGTLTSDIFVAPPSLVSRKGDGTIIPEVVERIRTTPGVLAVNTIRNRRVRAQSGEVDLHVPRFADASHRSYQFRAGDPGAAWTALEHENAVLVSEPYAFHERLDVGAQVTVATDHGPVPFRVVGVYVDYASDEGGIVMSPPVYEHHFDERGISGLGVVAAPGEDLGALADRIRATVGESQALLVRQSRALRDASMAIFDRTFVVTSVLRMLAVGVAFVGILSALMARQLERARELSVLRAIGLLPRQVLRLVLLETSLMGLCAGILALPLGTALAFILVFVVNRRSFGWTLGFDVSPAVLAEALVLALVAALLSGLYPSWKMARANPARALREGG
jgi:putative ABC transport system permease protein